MRILIANGLLAVTLLTGLVTAPVAGAEELVVCPSGMTGVATDDTSCAFAENVRSAWLAQQSSVVTAFSPVTQESYTMQCASAVTDSWPLAQRCAGVNGYGVGLVVYVATTAGSGSAASAGSGSEATDAQGANGSAPAGGVAVGVDSPNVPNVNGPNVGCTWVDGYTKSNGTHVSGYPRCG